MVAVPFDNFTPKKCGCQLWGGMGMGWGSKMCAYAGLMLRRYVRDLCEVVRENFRVLRPGGKAVYVVGNCNLRNTFIENSKCVKDLATEAGFSIRSARKRLLSEDRRYLPPPEIRSAGKLLRKRMREEVILTLVKE